MPTPGDAGPNTDEARAPTGTTWSESLAPDRGGRMDEVDCCQGTMITVNASDGGTEVSVHTHMPLEVVRTLMQEAKIHAVSAARQMGHGRTDVGAEQ